MDCRSKQSKSETVPGRTDNLTVSSPKSNAGGGMVGYFAD